MNGIMINYHCVPLFNPECHEQNETLCVLQRSESVISPRAIQTR